MWYVVCDMWYVVCGMWYAVYVLWYVVHVCGTCMWYVVHVCGMWYQSHTRMEWTRAVYVVEDELPNPLVLNYDVTISIGCLHM